MTGNENTWLINSLAKIALFVAGNENVFIYNRLALTRFSWPSHDRVAGNVATARQWLGHDRPRHFQPIKSDKL
jgi:hypothetical protein